MQHMEAGSKMAEVQMEDRHRHIHKTLFLPICLSYNPASEHHPASPNFFWDPRCSSLAEKGEAEGIELWELPPLTARAAPLLPVVCEVSEKGSTGWLLRPCCSRLESPKTYSHPVAPAPIVIAWKFFPVKSTSA